MEPPKAPQEPDMARLLRVTFDKNGVQLLD
jgi:hypothetical protein